MAHHLKSLFHALHQRILYHMTTLKDFVSCGHIKRFLYHVTCHLKV